MGPEPRLFPIPFRLLSSDQKYKKYQWIEADIEKRNTDTRPESYAVVNVDNISLLESMGTDRNWEDRKKIVFKNSNIYNNMTGLISKAHANELSLAIFKPSKIEDFIIEKINPDKNNNATEFILEKIKQNNLFDEQKLNSEFNLMPYIPYKFSYKFTDANGRSCKLMIEDWEIGQLYLNCEKIYGKEIAPQKVKEKYFYDFCQKKDLYLFLGTTLRWHFLKSPNPFVIIGTFHPPPERQLSLF